MKNDRVTKPGTTIIAIRHGETIWNSESRIQGHLDSELTQNGIAQAIALGKELKNYRIDSFYTSDLGRAIQTTECIKSSISLDYITNKGLRERNFGILQGKTATEARETHPQIWQEFKQNDPDYLIPKGESMRQKHQLAVQCIEEITKNNRNKSILLVSHGGFLISMLYRTLHLPLGQKRSFSLSNCALNIFSIDEEMNWYLETWGNVNHLYR